MAFRERRATMAGSVPMRTTPTLLPKTMHLGRHSRRACGAPFTPLPNVTGMLVHQCLGGDHAVVSIQGVCAFDEQWRCGRAGAAAVSPETIVESTAEGVAEAEDVVGSLITPRLSVWAPMAQ